MTSDLLRPSLRPIRLHLQARLAMLHALLFASLVFVFPVGCGVSGARPHDQSAAAHDRAAAQHEMAADLDIACVRDRNHVPTVSPATPPNAISEPPCAKGATQKSMNEHREAAAAHRAASADLRSAEANACAGISIADRDTGPFERAADITSVEPLIETSSFSEATQERQVGATVTFRAVPGMTAEWLQRLVDCQLARYSVLGHEVPEKPNSPLVPKGVEAHVKSVGKGIAVEIKSADSGSAREILERARRLPAAPTMSTR